MFTYCIVSPRNTFERIHETHMKRIHVYYSNSISILYFISRKTDT